MKIIPANITNTTKRYAQKLIIPAAFATGLTACVEVPSNGMCKQVAMQEQLFSDTFETNKKVKTIQAKEFNNNEKLFQKAIFQVLPYINDGKFKKVEVMKNGIILDGEYKLYKKGENNYQGSYSLFDNHSFKMDKLKNGNFNLIYKIDDDIEAVAFSKDGKLLSKFEAFEQNTTDGPVKISFKPKTFESIPPDDKNTDEKIVKFNNPLLGKELDFIVDKMSEKENFMEIIDIKQKGGKIIVKYNGISDRGNVDGTEVMTVQNPIGLYFEDTDWCGCGQRLNIRKLDNGGYVVKEGYSDEFKYFDKDLNEKDISWYKQDVDLRKKIEKQLSETQMKLALESIQNGKPALLKLDENYLILLPKANEKVVGKTSLSTRAITQSEQIKNAINNLDPADKASLVIATVVVGGLMVDALMAPTAPMIALALELGAFELAESADLAVAPKAEISASVSNNDSLKSELVGTESSKEQEKEEVPMHYIPLSFLGLISSILGGSELCLRLQGWSLKDLLKM